MARREIVDLRLSGQSPEVDDQRDGRQIGSVRQVGQSTLKKVVRVVSSLDQFFTHHLQVVDASNNVVLKLTRPAKFVKSRVVVEDGAGQPVGERRALEAKGRRAVALRVDQR